MRPQFLEIQAFGPYVELQRIDFDKFSGSNLFLLHGPTGAGKTTIFDAISCALFGYTTGDRQHKQMRSDFAPDTHPTIVKFCFRQRGNYYVAQYERKKKKRSEDFEDHRLFYRSDANGNPLVGEKIFNKTKEVDSEIARLLHFTKEQFLQIVVLPQGKFQQFLQANGEEKTKILSTIFQTERFAKVQEKLKERLERAQKELQSLQTARGVLLANLQLPEGESIESYLQKLREEQQTLAEQLQILETANSLAQQQLATNRALLADFQQFEQIQQQLNTHLASQETHQQHKQYKVRLENVRYLKPLFDRGFELKDNIKKKQSEQLQTALKKEQALQNCQQIEQDLAKHLEQKNVAEQAREEAQRLREKLPDFHKAAELQQEMKAMQQQLAAQLNSLEALQKEVAGIEEKIAANNKQLTELHQIAQQLTSYERTEKDLNALLATLQKLTAAQAAAAEAAKLTTKAAAEYDLAAKAAEKAHQQYRQTEQLWRSSQAALLAATLQPQQPCPVCGATEHPHPAQPIQEQVNDAALEKARQAKEQAEKVEKEALSTYQNAKTAQAEKDSAYRTLAASFTEGIPSQEDLEQQWKQAVQNCKNAEAAQKQLQALQQTTEQLKQQHQAIIASVQAAQEQRHQCELELSRLQSALQAITTRLPANVADAAAAEKKMSALANQYALWEQQQQTLEKQLSQARDTYTRLQTEAEQQQTALQEAERQLNELREQTKQECLARGFSDMHETRALIEAFSEDALAELSQQIEQWEKTALSLQTLLDEAQKKIAGKAKPDLNATEQQAADAAKALREYQTKMGKVSSNIERLQNAQQQMDSLQQQISEQELAIQPLEQLFDLANGDNQDKLRLHHFVLRFYFEEVLTKANLRLEQLSSRRYTLLNDETVGRGKDGMRLIVFDQHTGTTRPVENLSGGETFFTSLALALGLSDVITAQSGGIALESMFIDEGFGTLDSETLDLAIRTLAELEGSQRLVGIISHVNELKERIPAKIEVIKGQKGSKIVQT
ncbi:MAG: SMC family ATPase [Cytophagales bacterium]|nr:SMC family ATPase [Bernardetiaceae bacterium]MDW8205650.1 SMC family ATPase [Cytophagales bacterium]